MNADFKNIIATEKDSILNFLEELVNINSFTYNVQGVDKVAGLLCDAMPKSFSLELVDGGSRFAKHRVLSKKGRFEKPVVLVGHMDTLWKPEDPFNRLIREDNKLLGPAVNDMKAGLTVIVWALRVLENCGMLEDIPVTVVFNSDEEVGSVDSKKIFTSLKDSAAAGLVYEDAGVGGTIVTKRVGISDYLLKAKGVPAHAGLYYGSKASALLEIAHRIIWLESLNEERETLSVNVGTACGGYATNVVPGEAECFFEIRSWDEKKLKKTLDNIKLNISMPIVQGCELELFEGKNRPPLNQDERGENLFKLVCDTALKLGQEIKEEHRNGGSDASWLSSVGVPSIDGLGPVGDLDRTEGEYIITETLFDRIELTAEILADGGCYRI